MKKILLLLCLTLILVIPYKIFAFSEDDFEFSPNSESTCIIEKYNGNESTIKIPEILGGLTVTAIGDSAFERKQLTRVELPNTIKTIGRRAFAYCGLKRIDLPASVVLIDSYAFHGNELIDFDLIIPDNVVAIGREAFAWCGLKSVTLPSSVQSLGFIAFEGVPELKLPDNNQQWVGEVLIKDDMINLSLNGGEDIEPTGTYYIDKPVTISSENSIYTDHGDGMCTIDSYVNANPDYVFGKDFDGLIITDIGDYAFAEVPKGINEVPDTVVRIGESAFGYSHRIKLPKKYGYTTVWSSGVKGGEIFETMNSSPAISLQSESCDFEYTDNLDGTCTITDYVGEEKNLEIRQFIDELEIVSIASNAFVNKGLSSVTISESVVEIAEGAFNNNKVEMLNNELSDGIIYKRNPDGSEDESTIISYAGFNKDIDFIPQNATKIAQNAFNDCKLKSLIIPDNITYIGDNAFADNMIAEVIIPNNVTYVGKNAFANNEISSFILPNTMNMWEDDSSNYLKGSAVIADFNSEYTLSEKNDIQKQIIDFVFAKYPEQIKIGLCALVVLICIIVVIITVRKFKHNEQNSKKLIIRIIITLLISAFIVLVIIFSFNFFVNKYQIPDSTIVEEEQIAIEQIEIVNEDLYDISMEISNDSSLQGVFFYATCFNQDVSFTSVGFTPESGDGNLINYDDIPKGVFTSTITLYSEDESKALEGRRFATYYSDKRYYPIVDIIKTIFIYDASGKETIDLVPSEANIFIIINGERLKDISALSEVKNLEILHLEDCTKIENFDIGKSASKLKYLYLGGYYKHFSSPDLSFIENYENLESLTIQSLGSIDLSPIKKLTKLKKFSVENSESIENLNFLSANKNLKILSIVNCKNLNDISAIRNMNQLEYLDMIGEHQILDFESIYILKNLKTLSIQGSEAQMLEIDTSKFANVFDELTELSISHSTISDLSLLEEMEKLKILNLYNLPNMVDLSSISKLENLRHLTISDMENLIDINDIGSLSNLQGLSLSFLDNVSDISFISKLSELESLTLRYCDKVVDVSPIANLQELRWLHYYDDTSSVDTSSFNSLTGTEITYW